MSNIKIPPAERTGIADEASRGENRPYVSPKITTVKFKVEVGVDGSVTKVSSWGSDWTSASSGDRYGTEHYDQNTTQGSGFFSRPTEQ